MRPSIVIAAGIVVLTVAAVPAAAGQTSVATPQAETHQDFSAAKRKKRAQGHQAYGSGGRQIACTQLGCNPIPRGCRVVPGRIPFTWDPSGFDEVQCPYYR